MEPTASTEADQSARPTAQRLARPVDRDDDRANEVIAIVIAAVCVVMTFIGWTELGQMVGFVQTVSVGIVTLRLAWLLPISVDAYAGLAARVWLRSPHISTETRSYAKRSSIFAVVLSVAGQGIYHLVKAVDLNNEKWWPVVVVVIGAIPALQLALSLQLLDRVRKDRLARLVGPELVELELDQSDPTTHPVGATVVGPVAPSAPTRRRTIRRAKKVDRSTPTDDELLDKIRAEWPVEIPSRTAVMKLTSTGTDRAKRLLARLIDERSTALTTEEV